MQILIRNIKLFLRDYPETNVLSPFYADVDNPMDYCKGPLAPSPDDVWLRGINRIEEAMAEEFPYVIIQPLVGYHMGKTTKETKPKKK